jgi:hypothetical protein
MAGGSWSDQDQGDPKDWVRPGVYAGEVEGKLNAVTVYPRLTRRNWQIWQAPELHVRPELPFLADALPVRAVPAWATRPTKQ